jgi:hypothetical protein
MPPMLFLPETAFLTQGFLRIAAGHTGQ